MLCSMCKENKPSSDFYKSWFNHGPYKRCRNCDRLMGRKNRKNNPETFKKKDKKYYEKNREKIIERRKEYWIKNKHKIKAHDAVKKALYNGILTKQSCEVCGDSKTIAHHDDYSKQLSVRWLCHTCHMRHHHGKDGLLPT